MYLSRAPLDLGHENKLGHRELKGPESSKSSCSPVTAHPGRGAASRKSRHPLPSLRVRLSQHRKRPESAARGQAGVLRSCACAASSAVLRGRLSFGKASLLPVLWFITVGPGPSGCSVGGDPPPQEDLFV